MGRSNVDLNKDGKFALNAKLNLKKKLNVEGKCFSSVSAPSSIKLKYQAALFKSSLIAILCEIVKIYDCDSF